MIITKETKIKKINNPSDFKLTRKIFCSIIELRKALKIWIILISVINQKYALEIRKKIEAMLNGVQLQQLIDLSWIKKCNAQIRTSIKRSFPTTSLKLCR